MSKTFRRAAMSSICMLIVAVMSLTGATYAWFTSGEKAVVEGMTMNINTADGGIQASIGNAETADWGSVLKLTNATKDTVNPVSTVDAEAFFTATFNPENDKQIMSTADNSGDNILTQTFYIRNTGSKDVTVNLLGSYIENIANGSTTTAIGDAARFAIFVGDNPADAQAIFAAYKTGVNDDGTPAIQNQAETYYAVSEATADKAEDAGKYFVYDATQAGTSKGEVNVVKTDDATANITLKGRTTAQDGTVTHYPVKITVVAWLEGQDDACVNENAGGAFNVNLNFTKVAEPTT